MTVVSLADEKKKRELQPDPAHVFTDAQGQTWCEFAVTFVDPEGVEFCFALWALDHNDAERRVKALRETATLDGQIFSEVDA